MQPITHSTSLLNVYFAFRIGLGFLLLLLFLSATNHQVLGTLYPSLFFWTCLGWILLATFSLLLYPANKLTHSFHRITSFLVMDVLAILILIHASGGVESGFGYLLLIFVAIGSLLNQKKMAMLFAAMVSLLTMAQTIYLLETLNANANANAIFSAGILGMLLFITAYVFQILTQKINSSTQEAAAQAQYAAHLQQLAHAIVTRMRTGIIVLDGADRIELMNTAAQQLLDLPRGEQQHMLLAELPQLQTLLQSEPQTNTAKIQRLASGQEVRCSRAQIELGSQTSSVIFLEDYRAIAQQAQQLKLASLGRLTAGIAHEIRNPLGAISHAAQLLNESDQLSEQDLRLSQIIYQHAKRVNQIIENTLTLSRRKDPQVILLDLHLWLPHFIEEYSAHKTVDIQLQIPATPLLARVDTTNLQQILINLLDNGLRYSQQATGQASLNLTAAINPQNDAVYIDIIDDGLGIEASLVNQVFEPFYTTEPLGTGLGLYICKELCEINQASLLYKRTAEGKSCFRINFSHHLRMI